VVAALRPGDHALRVVLVPDPAAGQGAPGREQVAEHLATLRVARNLFVDDDRVELVGVEIPLPADLPASTAARAVVDTLDFTAPAWLRPGPDHDWGQALAVLAEDGAEGVALAAGGPDALPPAVLAGMLRAAVDRELTVRVTGGPLPWVRPGPDPATGPAPHGTLNLLCAVRAALNGADTVQLTAILAAVDPAPLLAAVRRMSDPDAVVVRAFLAAVPMAPVGRAVDDLAGLGLLPDDAVADLQGHGG